MYLDMPTCVSMMANNELEELERIICKKYKKFKWVYQVINQYYEFLEAITYQKETDDSEMVINLDFSDEIDISSVEDQLASIFSLTSEKNPDADCKWTTDSHHMTLFLSLDEI